MKILLFSTFIAAFLFLIIDVIWLSFSVKYFYRPNIGHLLLDKPIMWAAVMFYIIYVFGLVMLLQNSKIFLKILVSMRFSQWTGSHVSLSLSLQTSAGDNVNDAGDNVHQCCISM